jgi:hypothetical protein
MSKLIVEMGMPENCYECHFSTDCSFCEGYDDVCVLAPKDAVYKWNFSDGIKPSARPSWCPIKGVLPEEHGDIVDIDLVGVNYFDEIEYDNDAVIIAAERKDDEH